MRLSFLVSCWLLLARPTLFGQTAGLNTLLRDAATQLKLVKASEKEFKQQLKINDKTPYLTTFEVIETDKKGKTTELVYELNVADIDPASIKYTPRKDLMVISLKTLGGKDFIRVKENGQLAYRSDLTLYGDNVDNARALTDALRQLPPEAKNMLVSRLVIGSTLPYLTDWLIKNVVNATSGDEGYNQSVALSNTANPLRISVSQQSVSAKKSTDAVSELNVGDLDPASIKMDVKGKWVFVEAGTRERANYIRHSEGAKAGNENNVRFYFADVEKAREGTMVLQKLLPIAQQKQKDMAPAYRSSDDTQQRLVAAAKPVGTLDQSLKPGCQTVLTVTESGKTTEYRFFLGDLNEKATKISASGKAVTLELAMPSKQKYIEVWRNGEKQNYVGEVEIQTDDIELVRYLPGQLEKMIPQCRDTRKLTVPPGALDAKLKYIMPRIVPVQVGRSTVKQQLEKGEGCAFKLIQNTSDAKKPLDERFEFSLTEIDPVSVELVISGDEAYVQLMTKNKAKTIKTFKNGNPSDYVNLVRFRSNDVPTGLQLREGLRQAVDGCAKQ